MKSIIALSFLLGLSVVLNANANEAMVGIPVVEGTDPADIAAHLAGVAAAQSGEAVVVEDVESGQKVEAQPDPNVKPASDQKLWTWNIKFETGNHIIEKGTPLAGGEILLPGPMVYLAFGGEVSYKEWVSAGVYTGAASGVSVDAHPFKWFALRAPIHDYKLQPSIGYRWFHFRQRGTSNSKQPGQLWERSTNGFTWGLSYALSNSAKIYVQGGAANWREEYFVQVNPWINGPAETRQESKKRGTVFVGVSFKIF